MRAASFALLSEAGRTTYRDPETWGTRRLEIPPVAAYRLVSVEGPKVTVLVERPPGIDPFVGLQFAEEHQTWTAHKESDGWLVDPEPTIEPILPPDALARDAATRWVTAAQACDQGAAQMHQAVRTPFGVSAGASALCRSPQRMTIGDAEIAVPGPETAALVAQYSAGVLRYVRQTRVTGGVQPFVISMVPMGDVWQVIAIND